MDDLSYMKLNHHVINADLRAYIHCRRNAIIVNIVRVTAGEDA